MYIPYVQALMDLARQGNMVSENPTATGTMRAAAYPFMQMARSPVDIVKNVSNNPVGSLLDPTSMFAQPDRSMSSVPKEPRKISPFLGGPERSAALFNMAKMLDEASRANAYTTTGQKLQPGAGYNIADMGLKLNEPPTRVANANQVVAANAPKAGPSTPTAMNTTQAAPGKPGAISSVLGSDAGMVKWPDVGGIKWGFDEKGNLKTMHVQATSQQDLANAEAIRRQKEAGQTYYDPTKVSSMLGTDTDRNNQSPFV